MIKYLDDDEIEVVIVVELLDDVDGLVFVEILASWGLLGTSLMDIFSLSFQV